MALVFAIIPVMMAVGYSMVWIIHYTRIGRHVCPDSIMTGHLIGAASALPEVLIRNMGRPFAPVFVQLDIIVQRVLARTKRILAQQVNIVQRVVVTLCHVPHIVFVAREGLVN